MSKAVIYAIWCSSNASVYVGQARDASLKGHHVSAETVEKIRARAKGRPLPASTIEKLRGKTHSPATRAKMGAAHKGRTLTEATKAKLRGRIRSSLHRSRLAESNSNEWAFLSPCGELVRPTNLRRFCAARGLHHGHMANVFYGALAQHKGWRRAESEEEKLGFVTLSVTEDQTPSSIQSVGERVEV